MRTSVCLECEAEIEIPADAVENELLRCPDCGVELEIISLDPLTLELAPDVEEDWGE
ncbi:MAG: lysine biosynthesis protein LysW [Aggregatilineales bacterium]